MAYKNINRIDMTPKPVNAALQRINLEVALKGPEAILWEDSPALSRESYKNYCHQCGVEVPNALATFGSVIDGWKENGVDEETGEKKWLPKFKRVVFCTEHAFILVPKMKTPNGVTVH